MVVLGATEGRASGRGLARSLSGALRAAKTAKAGGIQGSVRGGYQGVLATGGISLSGASMIVGVLSSLAMICGPGTSGAEPLWVGGEHRIGAEERQRAKRRSRELNWRKTHEVELQAYAGQWVALEGEEIIANGADPAAVVGEARRKGALTPYVFKVERPRADTAWIGL